MSELPQADPVEAVAEARAEATPNRSDGMRAQLRTGSGWVLVCAGIGLVAGVIWLVLAPRVNYVAVEGGVRLANPQPEESFAADLLMAGLLAVGAIACSVWWLVRIRQRLLATLIGLLVGGLAAGVVAVVVGQLGDDFFATQAPPELGVFVDGPLSFGSLGMLLWWPCWVAVIFGSAIVWCGGTITPRSRNPRPHNASLES